MTHPTTPTGRRVVEFYSGQAKADAEAFIPAIEAEAAARRTAELALAGPIVTDKATLDAGMEMLRAEARRVRLAAILDALPEGWGLVSAGEYLAAQVDAHALGAQQERERLRAKVAATNYDEWRNEEVLDLLADPEDDQ